MRRSLLVFALIAVGCASQGQVEHPVDRATAHRAADVLGNLFPSKGLLSHKVSVRVARRDMVLTGYLLLDRESGFQAVAVDEFGGKVFEFSSCRGRAEAAVLPPPIEPDVVLRGPVADLESLVLATREPERVVQDGEGRTVAVLATRRGRMRCVFDPAVERLLSCVEKQGRRRIATFDFVADGGGQPSTIEVRNTRLHYRMTAELLHTQPRPDAAPCPGSGPGEG